MNYKKKKVRRQFSWKSDAFKRYIRIPGITFG